MLKKIFLVYKKRENLSSSIINKQFPAFLVKSICENKIILIFWFLNSVSAFFVKRTVCLYLTLSKILVLYVTGKRLKQLILVGVPRNCLKIRIWYKTQHELKCDTGNCCFKIEYVEREKVNDVWIHSKSLL